MSKEAIYSITQAYWSLGDYFSRLGGSARYWNMPESDIPLFVGCELAQRISKDFNAVEYIPRELMIAANPVVADIRTHLNRVNVSKEEMVTLLVDFISRVDGKYEPRHRSNRWEMFMQWVRAQTPDTPFKPDCSREPV